MGILKSKNTQKINYKDLENRSSSADNTRTQDGSKDLKKDPGLKIKSKKKYFSYVFWGIIILVLATFFGRVALWENKYYAEKEGSERAKVVIGDMAQTELEEISSEPVTDQEKAEYRVAAGKPRYMTIEKLGVKNARVIELGVLPNGQLQTPGTNFDVGWYKGSGVPGKGGTALFDGHNGGPYVEGVFKHLDQLVAGDIITITMGDDRTYNYRVYDNVTVPLSEANEKMHSLSVSPIDGTESISIITCTGEWSLTQKTYLSRQFLRATKV